MKVVIGADHAGFSLKKDLVPEIEGHGYEVIDVGTYSEDPVDYPDFAEKVGRVIQRGEADRGILVCGSGIGACIAANKMRGVYASIAHDTYSAAQGVEHDNMNVLCLGSRVIGVEVAYQVVQTYLEATFSTEERHHRRVAKIHRIEEEQ